MPARTRIEPDALVIQFDRDGEGPRRQRVVGGGERVLLLAVAMLIGRGELRLHDRLSVLAAAEADDETVEGRRDG
jgi:hypothetical protein